MRRWPYNLAAAALALLCALSIGCAAPIQSRLDGLATDRPANVWTGARTYEIKAVTSVTDGDTFRCRAYAGLQMERVINVRFGPASNGQGIDTPERGEPNYKEAGAALKVLLASTMPGPGTGRVTIKNRRAGLDEVEERSGDRYIGYVEYWDGRGWASVNDVVEKSQYNKLRK